MKNSYEASEISIISRIGSFVLGQKPLRWFEIDAFLGWGWGLFPLDDLDEGE